VLRKDIKDLINEIEQGEDYIIEETQPNIIHIKDVFNGLDRTLGKVSKTDFIQNLAMKEKFLENTMKVIILIDYTSEMKKMLNIKDVMKAVERIDEEYIDWLDVITSFIEDSKKREIMKGFLNNNSLTNDLTGNNNNQYNYDISDILKQTNPNAISVNADANYLRFMKQSAEQYQFKLRDVDVDLEDEIKIEKKVTVI